MRFLAAMVAQAFIVNACNAYLVAGYFNASNRTVAALTLLFVETAVQLVVTIVMVLALKHFLVATVAIFASFSMYCPAVMAVSLANYAVA
jgi:hypothetical protein